MSEVIPPREVGGYILTDGWEPDTPNEITPARGIGGYVLSDGWAPDPPNEVIPARPVGGYVIMTVTTPDGWWVGGGMGVPAEWSATVLER